MWYVYVLRSEKDEKLYVGSTNDLKRRLSDHNAGNVESTAPRKPFVLLAYFALHEKDKAIEFEKYLKTGSGKAFLQRRIL